ncbi:uncharacterized protein [Amphiura filiformis]|uniref:uncharacterized protein n=1 Tax=Amphiura filiformis TaxID=82378 RepID=UPI003B228592
MADDRVEDILERWELSQYIEKLEDEEIDMETFRQLDETTINQLFPKLGPRCKFMKHHQSEESTDLEHCVANTQGGSQPYVLVLGGSIANPHNCGKDNSASRFTLKGC